VKIGFSTIAIKLSKRLKKLIEEKKADPSIEKLFDDKNLNAAVLKSKDELIIITLKQDFIINNRIVSHLLLWTDMEITVGQKYDEYDGK